MTVRIVSGESVDRFIGQSWDIGVRITYGETLAVTITPPLFAATIVPTPVYDSCTGVWTAASGELTLPGRYTAIAETETGQASAMCFVSAVTLNGSMPVIADLDTYLGGAGSHSWGDAELQDALDVEAEAQRNACRIPAAYPLVLRQALLRRAARNLFMRRQLSEQPRDSEFDTPIFVPPGRDQEVRRLEGPYRKMAVG